MLFTWFYATILQCNIITGMIKETRNTKILKGVQFTVDF